jgi:hypothetical protein
MTVCALTHRCAYCGIRVNPCREAQSWRYVACGGFQNHVLGHVYITVRVTLQKRVILRYGSMKLTLHDDVPRAILFPIN